MLIFQLTGLDTCIITMSKDKIILEAVIETLILWVSLITKVVSVFNLLVLLIINTY